MVQIKVDLLAIWIACMSLHCHREAQVGGAVVLSQVTHEGVGGINLGSNFVLMNSESREVRASESLHLFHSKHSLVSNLPPGRYRVVDISLGIQDVDYFLNPLVDSATYSFFGELKVERDETYYMGNLRGDIPRKQPSVWIIEVVDAAMPKRLKKSLTRRRLIGGHRDLIQLAPYQRPTLTINRAD